MIIDMGYLTKVSRRIIILLLTLAGIYLAFKLAIFYMPFLIAFIISLLIEPIIKLVQKRTRLARKTCAIIVLIFVASIIITLLSWGITSLVSETSHFLQGLNEYIEVAYQKVQNLMENFDFSKFKIPQEVTNLIQNSADDVIKTVSNFLKNGLTNILNFITQIPTIGIYLAVTLMSIYFICADKFYMIDQMEHHLPKEWSRKITFYLKQIISALGGYLKAEATLIIISFFISLIGFYIFKIAGINIQYPLLIALGIAFVDALPILGSGTVMVPWGVISGINGDIRLAIAILILWIIMSVVRQFVEPRVVSTHIGIHPIFTLIAMYTGFKAIGVLGMFVGPIVLIILKKVFSTVIDKGVGKALFGR